VVAHVGAVDDALASAAIPSPSSQRRAAAEAVEDAGHLGAARVAEQADVRLRELVAEVGDEVADRAEQPGAGGTITGNEPISFASALACSGPAPP
jgi:hypothetical protein